MNKQALILSGIVILVMVCTFFIFNISGNVIANLGETKMEIREENFRIDDFGNELNEEVNNGTQNISGPE